MHVSARFRASFIFAGPVGKELQRAISFTEVVKEALQEPGFTVDVLVRAGAAEYLSASGSLTSAGEGVIRSTLHRSLVERGMGR